MTKPQNGPTPDSWPEHWKQTGYNGCLLQAVKALKYLANNERPDGGETPFNSAHLLQLADELGKTKDVLLAPRAASDPSEEPMTLAQIRQAAGGNPGITPTRQDVLLALKTLDEVCDEADATAFVSIDAIELKLPEGDPRVAKVTGVNRCGPSTTLHISVEVASTPSAEVCELRIPVTGQTAKMAYLLDKTLPGGTLLYAFLPVGSQDTAESTLQRLARTVLFAAERDSIALWAPAINAWAEAGGNAAHGSIADAVNELADRWWHEGAEHEVKAVHQATAALKQVLDV